MKVLRTYARVYAASLSDILPALAKMTGRSAGSQFTMPNGLELAIVGNLLVVAGDEQALAPYRATQATLIVDDLVGCERDLIASGGQLIRGPQDVPTGRNLTAELAGVRIEYVEWDADQWARVRERELVSET